MESIASRKLPVNMIVVGPPAAGKGTQAERIAVDRNIPKISTGEMLREAIQQATELGLRAKAVVERGELVDDDLMIRIVQHRLDRADARRGFILDGFPRTVAQAKALDQILAGRDPLVVIEIAVPDDELIRRMASRRICSTCGANGEPGDPMCRRCGGALVLRADDGNADVRQRRLQVYARDTEPIVSYYRSRPTFRSVNGAQSPDRVAETITAAIDSALETTGSSS
jgi:adenylate kinase